jgi:hypothetical protein
VADVGQEPAPAVVFGGQGGVGRLQLGGARGHGGLQPGLGLLQGALLVGELLGHGVEGVGHLGQLVRPAHVDAAAEVAPAEGAGAALQPVQPAAQTLEDQDEQEGGDQNPSAREAQRPGSGDG